MFFDRFQRLLDKIIIYEKALKIAQKILKSEEWLKAQEDFKYKSSNCNTKLFSTVKKYEYESSRPINVADLKISDLNIEPVETEKAKEDHQQRNELKNGKTTCIHKK